MSKVTTVNTITALAAALKTAQGGDRIELAPGDYAGFQLRDLAFADTVTVASADPDNPAVITGRSTLTNVTNLALDGLTFHNPAGLAQHAYVLTVDRSAAVTLTDLTMQGAATLVNPDTGQIFPGYNGLMIRSSTGVAVEGLDVSTFYRGVMIDRSADVRVAGSEFHHLRSDGLNFTETSGLVVEDNHFHSFTPNIGLLPGQGDHPDMIQYWGVAGGRGIDDVVIRDNVFRQGEGSWTQTIFGHGTMNGASTGSFTNFTISGNFIQNSHVWGISISDVVGLQIVDNVLIPSGALNGNIVSRPQINVGSSGYRTGGFDTRYGIEPADVEISGNVLTQVKPGALALRVPVGDYDRQGISVVDNAVIESTAKNPPRFWADLDLPPVPSGADLAAWIKDATTLVLEAVEDEFGLPTDLGGSGDADVLAGAGGGDLLDAGGGDDWVFGRDGDDTITGGAGCDTVAGGAGADRFVFARADFAAAEVDVLTDVDFAAGDTIALGGFGPGRFTDAALRLNALTVVDGGAGVVIDSFADLVELAKSPGITLAKTGDTRFVLGVDGVTLDLTLAADCIVLPKADPAQEFALMLADLAPTQAGTDGNDSFAGLKTGDVLLGGRGDDAFYARTGDDVLDGGAGRDRLNGCAGSDTMAGGADADQFHFARAEMGAGDVDRIVDFNLAEGDRLHFNGFGPGTFSDDGLAANRLQILHGGGGAIVDSLGDLLELGGLAGFSVARTDLAQLTLSVAGAGRIQIDIAGQDPAALDLFG